ncbi:MAG: DNA repair protein RecN [Acidobacteriaceae bacterium]
MLQVQQLWIAPDHTLIAEGSAGLSSWQRSACYAAHSSWSIFTRGSVLLTQLRVENYAVIDQLSVDFGAGLNLLTGETGAGKSILIDALSMILGDKASSDIVRHGTEKATVSAFFSLQSSSATAIAQTLEANGIDCDDPDQLIVRREVLATGKGRVFVNNQLATVGVLKQLAPALAFIHAQNETLARFDGEERRKLLDGFSGIDLTRIAESFGNWKELKAQILALEHGEQERLRMVDLWTFQRNEIDSAKLAPLEDERLETERRVLQNSEKLFAAATAAYEALYEEDHSAATTVRAAQKQVEELAKFDARFTEAAQSLVSARAVIEDVSAMAREYAESLDASPERLAEVEDRLAAIHLLKRKYGQTLDQVIAFGEDLALKLQAVENRDEILANLRKELAQAESAYRTQAGALSKARQESGKRLAASVERNVNELAMKARFAIEVSSKTDEGSWSARGWDEVEFLISTNAGEPMMPLQEIASGGELSRVMLALKASVFEATTRKVSGPLRTLVFDEIDTGIGGRAAEAVGQKLKQLARSHQVLCITHLPQIASFADQHFVIEKRETVGRTVTTVRCITGRERTEEIARMLSGAQLTSASIANAEQMLRANTSARATN